MTSYTNARYLYYVTVLCIYEMQACVNTYNYIPIYSYPSVWMGENDAFPW